MVHIPREFYQLVLRYSEEGIRLNSLIVIRTGPSDSHPDVLSRVNSDNFLPVLVPSGNIQIIIAYILVGIAFFAIEANITFLPLCQFLLHFKSIEIGESIIGLILREIVLQQFTVLICGYIEIFPQLTTVI